MQLLHLMPMLRCIHGSAGLAEPTPQPMPEFIAVEVLSTSTSFKLFVFSTLLIPFLLAASAAICAAVVYFHVSVESVTQESLYWLLALSPFIHWLTFHFVGIGQASYLLQSLPGQRPLRNLLHVFFILPLSANDTPRQSKKQAQSWIPSHYRFDCLLAGKYARFRYDQRMQRDCRWQSRSYHLCR